MRRRSSRIGRLLLAMMFAAGAVCPAAGAEPKAPVATIDVDGAGFLRNREYKSALGRLLGANQKANLDTNAIEDAAVILTSALGEEGFQEPVVEIAVTQEDGQTQRFTFDPTFAAPLPRLLTARAVTFHLRPGVRYQVGDVRFTGLTAIKPERARGFFRSDTALYLTARANAYSPSRVARAADALLDELRQGGYAEAEVSTEVRPDAATGRVAVDVTVREGPVWTITALTYQREEDDTVPLPQAAGWVGRHWSPGLQEDVREAIRQAYYKQGYPDVGVHVAADEEEAVANRRDAYLVATIVPGPRVTVGQVRFTGAGETRESVLRRRVTLATGDALDLVALERSRYRLSRLGVFEVVNLRYEPVDGVVRDPVFQFREGPRYETSLLMGYGSYEQVRGGVEHRQRNLFGLAHQSRLELVQSMKSSSGTYTYSVPELFGESLDGSVRLFGLQRKEVAFLRQEFGVTGSLRRALPFTGGEAMAGYTFQALRNRRNELSTSETDDRQLNVASVNAGLTGDRRDNPLRPRRGHHWSAHAEIADPYLGSQATYQRFEFAASYHTGWGRSRWVHAGLSHGVITTAGSDDATLPVNRRFFPGGDNSIRGYKRGEAAPRGADGRFVGAKSFLLLNLELEQALTPNVSVVAFWDALGLAEALRDYPYGDRLHSVGLGVRYQTLIGPIRLEYGRNVNPREGDPSGTWQFSIGYPF